MDMTKVCLVVVVMCSCRGALPIAAKLPPLSRIFRDDHGPPLLLLLLVPGALLTVREKGSRDWLRRRWHESSLFLLVEEKLL